MSKGNLSDKVKLLSYDEMLLGTEDSVAGKEGLIIDVPLSELHTFKNHPFRVLEDEKMDETVESVKEYGVLVPGIARERKEGGYEILSGHRRRRASELAGKDTMPMIIKNVSDDEAVVIMVDANIQREDILPSEKSQAYAMKFEALKHQGKVGGGLTIQKIGEASGDSAKTVQRYIQLSKLKSDLLQMVDDKRIGFGQGVDLSYLDENAQSLVCDTLTETKCTITGVQTAQIKSEFKEGTLTSDRVWEILNQKRKVEARKVVINSRKLDSYFSPNYTTEEIEEVIIKLLDEWKTKEGSEA